MSRNRWTPEQALQAARKGQARSRETRRAQMWARYQALASVQPTPFDAFLIGWDAHRKWSAVRRFQRRQVARQIASAA